MTRAELVQECIDRGWDYIPSSRIGSFVERSYQTLCARYPWSFLEATVTGAAPLAISDLRKVLSVVDTTNETVLRGADRRYVVSLDVGLDDTGSPSLWYLEGGTLKTWPVEAAASLSVRYVKRPAKLSAADEPLVPDEWQYLIVDLAVVHCLRDDDEAEEARALRADVEEAIRGEMLPALANRNLQNPPLLVRSGRALDYL